MLGADRLERRIPAEIGGVGLFRAPKLSETTETPEMLAAAPIAVTICWSELASTRTMFAPGASACTHSTSIDVSIEYPVLPDGLGSVLVTLPDELTPTLLKNPECSGMPN